MPNERKKTMALIYDSDIVNLRFRMPKNESSKSESFIKIFYYFLLLCFNKNFTLMS